MLNIILNSLGKIISFFLGNWTGSYYALVNLRYFRLYYRCLCCNSNQKAVQQYWCERNCEKKVAIFLMISVAHVADQYLVESTDVLRSVTTLFYLSNEGISIFENVCKIGLPLPGRLKNLLEKFKDIKNQAE